MNDRRLTPKQLELRRGVIGGTDAAPILGIGRRTAWDVYLDKTSPRPEGDPGPLALWGLILEPVVRARYELLTGNRVRVPKRLVRHPERRWQAGHLDGRTRGKVFEAKTARVAEGWGEPGSADIPAHHKAQVWHYMAVTGEPEADVAVLIGGSDFRIYTVPRVGEVDDLTAEEAAFYHDHLLPRVPPPFDGSGAANAWLRRRDPADDGSEWVAMPEQYGLLTDFVNAKHRAALWKQQEEALKQTIMEAMGPARKLLSPMVTITYAQAKPGESVDWESYAKHLEALLGEPTDVDTVRGLYTTRKEGTRRFTVHVPQLEVKG